MQLWSYEHFFTIIPSLIIMISIAFFLKHLMKGKSRNVRMIPFQILAVILILSEIIKQIVSIKRGYSLYHIPLHVCSLFIYFIPMMAFYRGKYSNVICCLTSSVCCALFMFMIICPTLIYTADNINNFFNDYLDFHTVFFHELVIFEFVLLIVLRLNTANTINKYFKETVVCGAIYVLIVAPLAQILKTNFSNFYSSNVPFIQECLEIVRSEIGYALAQSIYVLMLGILHILFFVFSYWVYLAIENKINNHKNN